MASSMMLLFLLLLQRSLVSQCLSQGSLKSREGGIHAAAATLEEDDSQHFEQDVKSPALSEIAIQANGALASSRVASATGLNYPINFEDLLLICGNDTEVLNEALKLWNHERIGDSRSLLDDFVLEKYVTNGTEGRVYRARRRHDDALVALKVIAMANESYSWSAQWYFSKHLRKHAVPGVILSEDQVYVLNSHEMPKLMRDHIGPEQEQHYVCLVEPWMPWGTLENANLPPEIALKLLTDVASTLATLERLDIKHRDASPRNIMLERKNGIITTAKLRDFGSAELHSPKDCFDTYVFGLGLGLMLLRLELGSDLVPALVKSPQEAYHLVKTTLAGESALQSYVHILHAIWSRKVPMVEVADMMKNATREYAGGGYLHFE